MAKKDVFYVLFSLLTITTSLTAQSLGCQAGKSAQAPLYNAPENLRSDTFDILTYSIQLSIGTSTNPIIDGNTSIRFAPKLNNRTFIRLDLLKLTVDSVKEGASLLSYSYNDTILTVSFLTPKNTIDTSVMTVYYHGQPQVDATGWGGFYFNNTQSAQYAYNLGVGFGAKPHNYGRVWFPCFDNFVERSRYDFKITSDSTRRAYCNGQLISDQLFGANRVRHWVMNEEIPTYLVSVAVARYSQVNWTVNTLNGLKPITLAAVAPDTVNMKNGFVNLKSCIQGFENYFGPYQWNRFGYCLVPFNAGAMEHATNIAYPRAAIGSLAMEAELMAHELSHHWWGNLITCETQEDMWINEGMATFSSYLFTEWQYGRAAYDEKVKTQHDALLHFLHHNEQGFRAVSGVPHNLTYGDHVYRKGADVAHTLRGYMGDSAFFQACKFTMQQKAFQSINSNELQNLFQTSSGQNLSDFFSNWIFTGGWSHFAIDSVSYQVTGGNTTAFVYIKQSLYGTTVLHNNVPLEISFFKPDWSRVVKRVSMSGPAAVFTLSLPYTPAYAALNYDGKINDATSHETKVIKTTNPVLFSIGKVFLQIQNAGADSTLLRVIHHYVKPEPFKNNVAQSRLSDQHFWSVEGFFSPGFVAKARFNYDGTKSTAGTYAYMDTLLTQVNDDSLGIFYRPDAAHDWSLVKHYTKFASGAKTGFVEVDTLKPGQYCFGNVGDTAMVAVPLSEAMTRKIALFPNPATQKFFVDIGDLSPANLTLSLLDAEGRLMQRAILQAGRTSIQTPSLTKGLYFVKIEQNGKTIYRQKILLN